MFRLSFSRSTWVLAGVAVLGVVAGIVGWGGFHTVVEATNTMTFCVSCHEMRSTVYEEYKTSVHYKNPSGVRATCSDCHVPKEWGPKMVRKVQATNELWHKVVGSIDTPEKFEAKRLTLARNVWASMKATDSRECRNCHSYEAMDFHKQRPKAAAQMQKVGTNTCIDCHKGIAHKLPDMTSGYKVLRAELASAAASLSPKAGDTVYTLETVPFWIDKPADTEAPGSGRILGGTAATVLERDGDSVRVRIAGWQQEGVARMLYARQGKRIFSVLINPDATEAVRLGDSVTDADTGQAWAKGEIDVWIANRHLVADVAKLWTYGAELYLATCTSCHSSPEPVHFGANEWIGTLASMKREAGLDDETYRFLQKYLQLHAKDVAAGDGRATH